MSNDKNIVANVKTNYDFKVNWLVTKAGKG